MLQILGQSCVAAQSSTAGERPSNPRSPRSKRLLPAAGDPLPARAPRGHRLGEVLFLVPRDVVALQPDGAGEAEFDERLEKAAGVERALAQRLDQAVPDRAAVALVRDVRRAVDAHREEVRPSAQQQLAQPLLAPGRREGEPVRQVERQADVGPVQPLDQLDRVRHALQPEPNVRVEHDPQAGRVRPVGRLADPRSAVASPSCEDGAYVPLRGW